MDENSIDLNSLNITRIAKSNPKSPIRFTTIALIAALLACIRVFQKLISKNEHKPTPSQPKNSCKKLLEVTNIIIKKVNKDIYDINRETCGSSDIYPQEYMCTRVETKVTTISIVTDRLSNKKDQSALNKSTEIQGLMVICTNDPKRPTLQNAIIT